MSQERVYRRGIFGIDEDLGPYAGLTAGETWNGWACPYFTRAIADVIVDDWNAVAEVGGARYDSTRDCYVFPHPLEKVGDAYDVHGMDIVAQEGGLHVHVYPIGACAWTWEEIVPGA